MGFISILVGGMLFTTLCVGWLIFCVARRVRWQKAIIGFAVIGVPFAFPAYWEADYMFIQEPLITAANDGDVAQVRSLLRWHADPNGETDEGVLALVSAAQNGHVDVVRVLIANGADVNARDGWGRSALTVAKDNGYEDVVRILLKAGAKPHR